LRTYFDRSAPAFKEERVAQPSLLSCRQCNCRTVRSIPSTGLSDATLFSSLVGRSASV